MRNDQHVSKLVSGTPSGLKEGTDCSVNDITVYKCDHEGRIVWQYAGKVVERGETWIQLTAIFNGREADLGFVTFRQGDVFVEWFFTDRWYNIFRIQDGENGRLKGWYCNVTRPAQIDTHSLRADDLALDVFVRPNGTIMLLDEDEFDELSLPAEERIAALRAVDHLREMAARRSTPFHEILSDTDRLG